MATLHNDSGNMSVMTPARNQDIMTYIEVILTPLVCVVGTVLNLLAVGAFMSTSLRRISCCLYLAMRSIAVFGFLISMGLAWSNTFFTLIRTDGICELTVFLSYFCPFLSVWMVVAISVENFIRIAQPSKVRTYCTPRVAKIVIGTLCVIGLVVYNFPLWTSKVVHGQCQVLSHFIQTVLILNYVDTALTLLAPFILMLILVPLVALAALHAFERKKRLSVGNPRCSMLDTSSRSPEAKVTHLLLAVSVVFLLLHTPFHAIRIKFFILTLADSLDETTRVDSLLFRVFQMVYHLDTCVSCLVYIIVGDNFRRVFCDIYFSGCRKWWKSDRHAQTSHVNPATDCTTTLSNRTASPLSPKVTCSKDTVANDDEDDDEDGADEESKTRTGLLQAPMANGKRAANHS